MSRFLSHWRTFFWKATDASAEYCEGAGLMALSSIALARRSLDRGRGLAPNLFIMHAGDSSVARKSTSVNLCKLLVDRVDPQRVGPRDYTVEGLLKWMTTEKDPTTGKSRNKVVLFAEEFGSDLARIEAYGSTTFSDFCALYDGNTFEKVRAKAPPIIVEKPRVNLFAASAYQMLATYLKTRDWLSGYMMRFIYVTPVTSRPKFTLEPPFPKTEFEAAVVAAKVLRDDLARHYRTLKLTAPAQQLFEQWAQAVELHTAGLDDNSIAHTYVARFVVNVQKMALLYQLDLDPDSDITLPAAQQAIDFASSVCWPSFLNVHQRTTTDDFAQLGVLIMDQIKKDGPMLKHHLAEEYRNTRLFRVAIDNLLWGGLLLTSKDSRGDWLYARGQTVPPGN